MAGSDEFQNALHQRIGDKDYQRLSKEGLDDADDKGRYTGKEVISEMRNGRNGKTTEEMASYYQDLADKGTKFNGKAQEFLTKQHGVSFNKAGGNNGGGNSGGGNSGGGNNGGGGGNNGGGNNGGGNSQMSHADRAIQGAKDVENIDFGKLEKSIHERPLYMQAQADINKSRMWGDMWSEGYGYNFSRGNRDRDDD